jgi:hypothetical protein
LAITNKVHSLDVLPVGMLLLGHHREEDPNLVTAQGLNSQNI